MLVRGGELVRTRLPFGAQVHRAANDAARWYLTNVMFKFDNDAEHYATGVVAVQSPPVA